MIWPNPSTRRNASGPKRRRRGPTCVLYYSSGQMKPQPNLEKCCTEGGAGPPTQWSRGLESCWIRVLETFLKSPGPPLQHLLCEPSPASTTESQTGSDSGRSPAQLQIYRTCWKPRSKKDGKGISRRECLRPRILASRPHPGPVQHPGLFCYLDSWRLGIQRKPTVCLRGSPVSIKRPWKKRKPQGMKLPRIQSSLSTRSWESRMLRTSLKTGTPDQSRN